MSAKMHHVLAVVLTFAAFFAAGTAFYFAASKLYGPTMRWALANMHPFAASIAFDWVLPPAFVLGSTFLVRRAMNKLIPARCPRCGNRSYRHRERGQRVSDPRAREWITYRCRSCGHIENTGWTSGAVNAP
jgi:predicted nucleic-acid-binding Zn-ribbon protein